MPKKTKGRNAPADDTAVLRFSKVSAILAATALAVIVIGYYLLAGGSVTLAPLLLVLGYVVLLPLAIIL